MDELTSQRIRRAEIWSGRFKQTAADMLASAQPDGQYPPHGIDPALWKAQIEACKSMANDLDEQVKKMKCGEDV